MDVAFALQAFLGVSDSLVWSRGGLGGSWTETSRAFHRSTSYIDVSERWSRKWPRPHRALEAHRLDRLRFHVHRSQCRIPTFGSVAKLGEYTFQIGKLSFFNCDANRGSWCKLFSRGSTLVSMRPALRWT